MRREELDTLGLIGGMIGGAIIGIIAEPFLVGLLAIALLWVSGYASGRANARQS